MAWGRALALGFVVCLLTAFGAAAQDGPLRQRVKERLQQRRGERQEGQTLRIAGLDVSVWSPSTGLRQGAPLVVFSHGFHGSSLQSTFLMDALAQAGYLVVAPNHKDAIRGAGSGVSWRPEIPFQKVDAWTEATFQDRRDDVVALLNALKADPEWNARIDWSKVAMAGHSLGGYTALALAGAWPSWKLRDVKAVLALSPYTNPLVEHGQLNALGVPVMYQTGTWDKGVAPFLKRPGGAYERTSGPAYFVEFQGAAHFAWTDLRPDFQQSITYYSRAFLNKHLLGDDKADPLRRRPDVSELRSK